MKLYAFDLCLIHVFDLSPELCIVAGIRSTFFYVDLTVDLAVETVDLLRMLWWSCEKEEGPA